MNKLRVLLCVAVLAAWPGVALASDKNPSNTDTERTIRGCITAAQPSDNQFTLRTKSGKELKLHVDAASRLQLNGRAASLTDFKKGNRVRVTFYEMAPGMNRVLSMADSAPTTAADLKRGLDEFLRTLKDSTVQQKERHQQQLQQVLNQIDEQIDDLEEQAAKSSGAARQELQQAVEQLRQRRESVNRQSALVRSASPEVWVEVVRGVSAALMEFQQTYQRTLSKFEPGARQK